MYSVDLYFCRINKIKTINMLGTLIKRRLSDNQVANVFVNTIFEVIDKGFKEVALLINEDTAFVKSPNIQDDQESEFTMIVLVGNISLLENAFDPEQATSIENLIFEKLSKIYDMQLEDFVKYFRDFQSYISRKNHPSKNMIYGMSKALFFKYVLNVFQGDYFKTLSLRNIKCNYFK